MPTPPSSSSDETPIVESQAPAEIPATTDAEQTVESSTTETPGEKPTTLLDVVRGVVKEEEGKEDSPATTEAKPETPEADPNKPKQETPPPSGEPGSKEEEASADADKGKAEEDLPFHKHPRFQEVIAERNSFRDDATQFRAISGYMSENNLSPDEVDQGFAIMAAIKNDPLAALEMLTPTIISLQRAAGLILPDDLTGKVDAGEMSEEAAQELARTRNQLAHQEARRNEEVTRFQAQTAAQTESQIIGAVTSWESQIASRDPDYAAKKPLVIDKIKVALAQTPARNPQEALAIAGTAYKAVTDHLKSVAPKRPEIKSPMSTQSVTSARPVVKSLRDAINRAVT